MESELFKPSAQEASRLLKKHDEAADRAELYEPSRSYALFHLWSGVLTTVYVAVFLLSFGGRPLEANHDLGAYVIPLMVYPTVVYSFLSRGTRERFGFRTKPTTAYGFVSVVVGVGMVVLLGLTILEIAYPWWLNLVVPIIIFVVVAISSVRMLRRARVVEAERWRNVPLSRPVRRATAVLGVVVGATVAVSAEPWFGGFQALLAAAIVLAVVGNRAKWGLQQVGFEWGPLHWSAFGLMLGVLFALTSFLARTDLVTTGVAIAAGAGIAAGMVLAAFLPLRRRA